MWDFQTALGDTIRERYENEYVRIVEISHVVNRRTLRGGANWIIASPEVFGFAPIVDSTEQINWKKEGF